MTARMAERLLVVEVVGEPAPQGSKRHVGNGRMVESSRKVAPWRDTVAWTVRAEAQRVGWRPVDGPVGVSLRFRLWRPPSVPRARVWPHVKPDADKLARSTLDALVTAGVLVDDARVVALHVTKEYAPSGAWTGCVVMVENKAAGESE